MVEHNNGASSTLRISSGIILWGIASLVIAIIFCTFNHSALVLSAGTFTKICAVIVGTVGGIIGVLLGNAIKNFTQPDHIYTNGGMLSILWIKLFWLCGPPIIGLIIGVAAGITVVLQ